MSTRCDGCPIREGPCRGTVPGWGFVCERRPTLGDAWVASVSAADAAGPPPTVTPVPPTPAPGPDAPAGCGCGGSKRAAVLRPRAVRPRVTRPWPAGRGQS